MDGTLTLQKIFDIYKGEFNTAIKEAYNSVRSSRQFTEHSEYLQMETFFNELMYLTSYENFGKLEDFIKSADFDNKSNYAKFKHVSSKLNRIFIKLKENLNAVLKLLDQKKTRPSNLKTQVDMYRLANGYNLLNGLLDPLKKILSFFDVQKALLSFDYQVGISYSIRDLTQDMMTAFIETREKEKIRRNFDILEQDRTLQMKTGGSAVDSVQLRPKQEKKADYSTGIAIYCGNRSSNDTLTSYEQYTDAIRKHIKKYFDDLRLKTFILPKFYFILKDYVFDTIKQEMTDKQILYCISNEGDKIFPGDLIKDMIEAFFRSATREYFPTPADYMEQAQRIEDSIFFEIANIENQLSRKLSALSENDKKEVILRSFKRDMLGLYQFLLPPQKKIDMIIISYLRR